MPRTIVCRSTKSQKGDRLGRVLSLWKDGATQILDIKLERHNTRLIEKAFAWLEFVGLRLNIVDTDDYLYSGNAKGYIAHGQSRSRQSIASSRKNRQQHFKSHQKKGQQ